jgi:hypothetical protein
VYSVIDKDLPGAWRYRMDRIWHNTDTNELVTIRRGTMAEIGDGDGYKVSIHREGSVATVLDNIPLERANETVALYIRRGEYPEESWLCRSVGIA